MRCIIRTNGLPLMTESSQFDLPRGWRSDLVAGGVDLRVVSSGREYVVVGVGILAVLAGLRTIVQWNTSAEAPWLILTVILGAVALWCALGDEAWHLERNCLVHRTGFRRWSVSRRYQNASLDIRQRFSRKWSFSYYRLYAVIDGRPSFLMERDEQELLQLARFISHHTGWQIRTLFGDHPGVSLG